MSKDSAGSKLKQLLNHSVIYGLTSSMQSVLAFVLLPILTSYYSTELFGIYSIILVVTSFASAIFYLGASSALGRFYHEDPSENYSRSIITATLMLTAFGAVLLILIAIITGKWLSILLFSSDKYYLHIVLGLSSGALTFIFNALTLIIRYQKKSFLFFTISISGVLINFIVTYVLLSVFGFGILAPILGTITAYLINILILLNQQKQYLTFNVDKNHFKLLLKFGLPLCISGLTFYLLDWADRFIIKDLLDLSTVGVYSLGARLAILMNVLFITPFTMVWAPLRMEYKNNPDSNKLLTKVMSYFTIIGICIVLPFILFSDFIIGVFFPNPDYIGVARLIPILLLAQLVFGYQNIVDYGIYIKNKTKFYIFVSLIGIVINVLLNYLLIPKFGYIAAAYITLLTYLISSSLIYLISSRYYLFTIEWKRVLIPICYSFLVYSLVNFSFILDNYLIRIFILALSLSLLWIIWLNNEERAILMNKFRRLNIRKL